MTFSDFANIVCQKVGELDMASVAAAQQFAMNRYRIIFNQKEWAETVPNLTFQMPSFQLSGTMTNGLATVTGISSTAGLTDGMLISNPPGATPGLPAITYILSVDSGSQITLTQNYTGTTGTVSFTASTAQLYLPSMYGEFISSAWTPDPNKLVPIPAQYRELPWVQTNAPGLQLAGISAIVPAYYWQDQTLGIPAPAIKSNTLNFSVQAADSCTITIHGLAVDATSGDTQEQWESLTVQTSGPGTVTPANNFSVVWSISKTLGSSRITVNANGQNQYVMYPRAEEFKFSTLMFLPVPKTSWVWLARTKIRCPDANDLIPTDAPIIRNLEDAIISYTQADMLERQRQYSKANMLKQEAQALVESAYELQKGQSEHVDLITPDVYDYCHWDGRYTWRPTTSFF